MHREWTKEKALNLFHPADNKAEMLELKNLIEEKFTPPADADKETITAAINFAVKGIIFIRFGNS